MQVVCAVCKEPFEAKRSSAKFCSGACRLQSHRGSDSDSPGRLVLSVTRDLEAAGVIDSYPAQLAIELARQMTAAGSTGIAGLSKELRTVMAAALGGAIPAADDGPAEEDEVAKARRARELKARNAAG